MAAVRVPPSAWSTSQSRVSVRSGMAVRSTTARRLRPIRRWISAVRPEGFPCETSRALRVWVARGSIEYSAVSHPSPLSFLNGGTRFSTLAATSTRVSPSSISAEPSANFRTPVSMRTGRRASAGRPSGSVGGWVGGGHGAHSIRDRSSVHGRGCVDTSRRGGGMAAGRSSLNARVQRTEVLRWLPAELSNRSRNEKEEDVKKRFVVAPLILLAVLGVVPRPGVQPPRGAGHHRDAEGGRHRLLHVPQLRGRARGLRDADRQLPAAAGCLRRPELLQAGSRTRSTRSTSTTTATASRTSPSSSASATRCADIKLAGRRQAGVDPADQHRPITVGAGQLGAT